MPSLQGSSFGANKKTKTSKYAKPRSPPPHASRALLPRLQSRECRGGYILSAAQLCLEFGAAKAFEEAHLQRADLEAIEELLIEEDPFAI
jgi:hypothetical protein